MHRVAVHGGKQARGVNRGKRLGMKGGRIHHGEGIESLRKCAQGGGNGGFVSRHAGDERRGLNVVLVELRDPSLSELLRFLRRQVPAQLLARGLNGQARFLRGQGCEKAM